jgi:hypothetical protein
MATAGAMDHAKVQQWLITTKMAFATISKTEMAIPQALKETGIAMVPDRVKNKVKEKTSLMPMETEFATISKPGQRNKGISTSAFRAQNP